MLTQIHSKQVEYSLVAWKITHTMYVPPAISKAHGYCEGLMVDILIFAGHMFSIELLFSVSQKIWLCFNKTLFVGT
jgi:hypothetical protein